MRGWVWSVSQSFKYVRKVNHLSKKQSWKWISCCRLQLSFCATRQHSEVPPPLCLKRSGNSSWPGPFPRRTRDNPKITGTMNMNFFSAGNLPAEHPMSWSSLAVNPKKHRCPSLNSFWFYLMFVGSISFDTPPPPLRLPFQRVTQDVEDEGA